VGREVKVFEDNKVLKYLDTCLSDHLPGCRLSQNISRFTQTSPKRFCQMKQRDLSPVILS